MTTPETNDSIEQAAMAIAGKNWENASENYKASLRNQARECAARREALKDRHD